LSDYAKDGTRDKGSICVSYGQVSQTIEDSMIPRQTFKEGYGRSQGSQDQHAVLVNSREVDVLHDES